MTPKPHQHEKAIHTVHIHVNGGGLLYKRPDNESASTIVVRRGDQVKWHCEHGNYSVLFKGESPFAEIAVHGRRNTETVHAIVVGDPGSYNYAVTVSLDHGLLVDDPVIIVDE
jgi:plastocyanin